MRKLFTVRHIVVHHSESPGGGVEFVRRVHVRERGYADIGYHYIIGNGIAWGGLPALAEGATASGRDVIYQGAHCRGHNADSIGVCLIGSFDHSEPTRLQIDALIGLLADLCRRYRLPVEEIYPHSRLCSTRCPGDHLRDRLPGVVNSVRGILAAGGAQ